MGKIMPKAEMSRSRLWAVMIILILAEIIASLEGSMIFSALPTITKEYGDFASTSWLVTAYTLMTAASAAIGGRLGDMFGRRKVLIAVLLLCSLGSLLSATSDSLFLVIIGRAIQGVTGAILPLCFGIARQIVPEKHLATWIGILTGAWSGSAAIGFVLGGYFADSGHWRALFWLTTMAPLVVVAGVAALVPVITAARKEGSIDFLGGTLFVPAIVAALLGLHMMKDGDTINHVALLVMGAGLAGLAFWFRYEWRHANPLINVRLLANRQVLIANLLFVSVGMGAFQLTFVLMPLVQQPIWTGVGLGVTATVAGLLKLPSNIVSMIAGPMSGFIASRHSARLSAIIGGICGVIAWVTLSAYHVTIWQVVLVTIIAGFGSSMVMAAVPNLILEVVPEERSSEATGLAMVVRGVSASIGTQILAQIMTIAPVRSPDGHVYTGESAFVAAMLFIAAVSAFGVVMALMLPRRRGGQRVVVGAAAH